MLRWLRNKFRRRERDYGKAKKGSGKPRTRSWSGSPREFEASDDFPEKGFDFNSPSSFKSQEEAEDTLHADPYNDVVADPGSDQPQNQTLKDQIGDLFVVQYDYNARTGQDLTIKKNQVLRLENPADNGWWIMKDEEDNISGFVPANYLAEYNSIDAEPWFFGRRKRVECENKLLTDGNNDGSYLVRESESRSGEYSLSVRQDNRVRHYKLHKTQFEMYYLSRDLQYKHIRDLIQHYKTNQGGLCCRLILPCVETSNPETVGLSHDTCHIWEIPRDQIKLGRQLGSGNFGEVYEGLWNDSYPIAVKTLKSGTMPKNEFLDEARFLTQLQHPNILKLYAVCTMEEPLYIITELMKNGSLLHYLRGLKVKLSMAQQIHIGAQVAAGMCYLEAKHCIHRDLAARNILVGEDYHVKVADFGLSRLLQEDAYDAREGAQIPIKWTAPEAIEYSKFTTKSDVWSFGILLFEIITHGAKPYHASSNLEVADMVKNGYRLPKPLTCPDMLYSIMLETWNADPMKRPTFETLSWQLEDYFLTDNGEYKEPSEIY